MKKIICGHNRVQTLNENYIATFKLGASLAYIRMDSLYIELSRLG